MLSCLREGGEIDEYQGKGYADHGDGPGAFGILWMVKAMFIPMKVRTDLLRSEVSSLLGWSGGCIFCFAAHISECTGKSRGELAD